MAKVVAFGEDFNKKVRAGMDMVHKAVSMTLGPKGFNVVLDRGFSVPIVTNDGVSIARAMESDDDVERQGVELIKEVALKTNEMAGDGTTTSIVLAHALVEEGEKCVENPMEIRRGLEKASVKVVDALKKMSRPIKNRKELLNLAVISSESEEIGNIIVDTIDAIGKEGVISVEESKGTNIETKIVEGYELAKGFASPYMQTKEGKAEYTNVPVFVIGRKLSTITELLPFFQKISKVTKELVIFCVDIDPSVINQLIFNKQQGFFNTLVVKAHSQNNEILEDVALVTGATFIADEGGFNLDELDESCLGKAEKISSTKDKTVILKGKGSKVKAKVRELKAQLPSVKNDNEYDLIETRIGRLSNSIAVISVGAKTESEMRYLYYKIEDAVSAVKSALEEGVVPGGGMTLYKLSQILSDKEVGERILKRALKYPLKKIIENCGKDYEDIVMSMPKGKGYDGKNDVYVDMIQAGIIDPTKVERCCIENAVSFAGTFLTSKAVVALYRENPKANDE